MTGDAAFGFAIVFVFSCFFSVITARMAVDAPSRTLKWITLGISFLISVIAITAAIGIAFYLWSIIL